MDQHDVNLNIHYTAPDEVWDKIEKVYRSMEYWVEGEPYPTWKSEGIEITASVEPSGIQLMGIMPDECWDDWYEELKEKLTAELGFQIGEPEDGYEFKYWDNPTNERKIKYARPIGILVVLLLVVLAFVAYHYFSVERDGEVRAGYVRVGERYYEGISIEFSKEGKTIGKIDGFDINEIPEDPKHNFLVVRSFQDQYYVVDREYSIPISGKLSCAYVANHACDEKTLQVISDILQQSYDVGFEVQVQSRSNYLRGLTVGYGDCPVATDNGYFLGRLEDGRWVLINRQNYEYNRETDMIRAICHEIPKEQGSKLQASGLFD